MKIAKRLALLFSAGNELDEFIERRRREKDEQERLERMHHLNLCRTHQQEQNRSHFSERNCHYCQLLARLHAAREAASAARQQAEGGES